MLDDLPFLNFLCGFGSCLSEGVSPPLALACIRQYACARQLNIRKKKKHVRVDSDKPPFWLRFTGLHPKTSSTNQLKLAEVWVPVVQHERGYLVSTRVQEDQRCSAGVDTGQLPAGQQSQHDRPCQTSAAGAEERRRCELNLFKSGDTHTHTAAIFEVSLWRRLTDAEYIRLGRERA